MSDSVSKKGISFVPTDEITEKTKVKIDKLVADKKERLNKLVEDYNAGKYELQ